MIAFTHHVQPAGSSVSSPLLDFRLWVAVAVLWCLIYLRRAYRTYQYNRKRAEARRSLQRGED